LNTKINHCIEGGTSVILIISGSPRKGGNTDCICNLLKFVLESLGQEVRMIRIYDYNISPCTSCRLCLKTKNCSIRDDMDKIVSLLLDASGIIIVSPVFFDSIPSQLKAFIDRTWSLKGKLKNKIGGVVVVGRRYGHHGAITTLISFMLKHEMILGMRGVVTFGFGKKEVIDDVEGLNDVKKLAKRVVELINIVKKSIP